MKKYFLLIALCSFVFLWLGNYSFGQTLNLPQNSNSFFNDTPWVPTETPTNPDQSTGIIMQPGWQPIVTEDPNACNGKPNSHLNSITQKCVCNGWYKDIDNVCVSCKAPWVCCGVQLNTSVPFIGNCIEDDSANVGAGETTVTWATAFPVLMWSLTKILVTVILILSFVLIVIWGIMITTGNPSGGKSMIIKVVVGIALLGASGVILRLINPNFFG